jgi:PAS domain S-box-containing protein
MPVGESGGGSFAALRRRAEAFLAAEKGRAAKTQTDHDGPLQENPKALVHELNVAHTELEMQNDELRRAQEELAGIRDELADLFELAPIGYLTLSAQGAIVQANQQAMTMLDQEKKSLVGRQFASLTADQAAKDTYYAWRAQLLGSGGEDSAEVRLGRGDGRTFVAQLRGRRRGTDLWLTVEDVTARTTAERRNALTTRVLEILNNAGRPSSTMGDVSQAIREELTLHSVAVRLLAGEDYPFVGTSGCPPDLIRQGSSLVTEGPSGPQRDREGRLQLAGMSGRVLRGQLAPGCPGGTPGGSFVSNNRDGLLVALTHHNGMPSPHDRRLQNDYESIALVPIQDGSEMLGLLQLLDSRPGRFDENDIDFLEKLTGVLAVAVAKQRAEQKRREVELAMMQAQKLESLGVLAGGIAHDFNNLLTPVLGNAQIALQDPNLSSLHKRLLEPIEAAAKEAARLVRQLLTYVGRAPVELGPVGLNELVEQMQPLLDRSVSKGTTLRYELASDLPAVHADSSQMGHVVMNLVINASESLGDRPGVVRIKTGTTTPSRVPGQERSAGSPPGEGLVVFLSVADEGCGMDQETVHRLYEPFFSTKSAGRGLGLAAVNGIVRAHHGTLAVESNINQGSKVTVRLPMNEGTVRPAKDQASQWPGARRSGTILVVDDEDIVRVVLRRMLENVGYTVLEATNGREAVAVFAVRQAEVDCILLDYSMPDMDGIKTFGELQEINKSPPVLLCSGYSPKLLEQEHQALGLAGFLSKPFEITILLDKLDEIMKRSRNA